MRDGDEEGRDERLFRRITDLSPDIVYVIDLIVGVVVFANDRARDLVGDYALRRAMQTRDGLRILIHPDDLPGITAHGIRLTEAPDGEIRPLEYRIRRAEGDWALLSGREQIIARLPDGQPHRVLGVAVDRTEDAARRAALAEARAALAAMAEASPALMWSCGPDGRPESGNANLLGFLGVALPGLRQGGWARHIHPEERAGVLAAWGAAQAEGRAFQGRFRLLRSDGVWRTVACREVPASGTEGRPTRRYGSMMDVHDQAEAEAELRLSHERLRFAIDTTSVVMFNHDLNLRYIWVHHPENGDATARLVGRTDHDIFERPADAEAVIALKKAVLHDGRPLRQTVGVRIGGRERWYDLSIRPLRDGSGGICGLTCAAMDVSATQRTLDDLARSRERFRATQELSLDGVLLMTAIRDDDGRIADFVIDYANPMAATLLVRSVDALVGRRLLEVLPDQCDHPDLFRRYVGVAESGTASRMDVCNAGSGEPVWLRSSCVKLGDGVAVQLTDISANRRHEDERRRDLERRALLLRELNHRIKNSLQLVASLLRLQCGHILDPAVRAPFERACERVGAIADLHAVLYMDEESGSLDFGSFLSQLTRRLAADAGMAGRIHVMQAEGVLDVDTAIPLGIVANELITLGLGAGGAGNDPVVTIGFIQDSGAAVLRVRGRGASVDAEQGLPLRIVRALVAQLDGGIELGTDPSLDAIVTIPRFGTGG